MLYILQHMIYYHLTPKQGTYHGLHNFVLKKVDRTFSYSCYKGLLWFKAREPNTFISSSWASLVWIPLYLKIILSLFSLGCTDPECSYQYLFCVIMTIQPPQPSGFQTSIINSLTVIQARHPADTSQYDHHAVLLQANPGYHYLTPWYF